MTEFIIKVPENKKGKVLLDFLRQIDFIEIDEATELFRFEKGISHSFADLKQGKTISWKNKSIRLKHA
jgi:hypothetical protein